MFVESFPKIYYSTLASSPLSRKRAPRNGRTTPHGTNPEKSVDGLRTHGIVRTKSVLLVVVLTAPTEFLVDNVFTPFEAKRRHVLSTYDTSVLLLIMAG